MNENDKDTGDLKRGAAGGAGAQIRRGPAEAPSHVRQSFSHGRSKAVLVEHVKRKTPAGPPAAAGAAAPARPGASSGGAGGSSEVRRPAEPPRRPPLPARPGAGRGSAQPMLSEGEAERRARALEAAKRAAEQQRQQAVEAARRAQEEEAARKIAAEESARKAAEEAAARMIAEAAAARAAAEEAAARAAAEEAARKAAADEALRKAIAAAAERPVPPRPAPPPAEEARAESRHEPRSESRYEPRSESRYEPRGDARPASRPYGERSYGDRPQGDRPYGDRPPRPPGDRPYGDRPQGDRPYGDRPPRPYGDRPQGDRPQGDRPYGDRPPRPYGDRPQGDRPPGDRPYGDRPPRPYGDRPQGDRPYGDRPPRPPGDRPYGDRPPRPEGGGFDRGPRPMGGDPSVLSPRLPGPKIISRAADRPEPPGLGGRAEVTAKFAAKAPPKPKVETDRERAVAKAKEGDRRRGGRLTIDQALDEEGGARQRSLAAMRRRQEKARKGAVMEKPAKVMRDVKIPDAITVQELANRMAERSVDVIKSLMKMGMMATINQTLDADTAQIVVEEFGHTPVRVSDADVEDGLSQEADADEDMIARAPIVTIMGHVDHGKTSLLDALRKTNVVAGEAGGITQHIGAYQVRTAGGVVTFLDTPGHAAFTSMRSRGAQVTDIVVLVVAADDSVMPQTVEAINHAKAAGVPMIVAINKVDKPSANAQKVREELLRYEVVVEQMGGDTLDVEVSAKTGKGLDKLVETILLQAEVLDLRANPDRPGEGAVIEAKLDVGRGPVATVLIERGTLAVGDIFVVGEQWGKVRALINDKGERVDSAGPSEPVEVLGLTGAPEAGDRLQVVEDENQARQIADYRQHKAREKAAVKGARVSLDQLLAQAKSDSDVKELPVVVKSDVQGSAEAILQALEKIGNDEVRVRVLQSGVGAITESDVNLAVASRAPIIGFNVRANAAARDSATQKGVEIRYYSIIYDLVDDVKKAASGLLPPETRETIIGNAQILQVFKISGVGAVAGCRMMDGVARRSAGVRLLRDSTVIHTGKLSTLKRFKDEVKEVQSGQECGMAFENYQDLREGDVIEIFETQTVERTL